MHQHLTQDGHVADRDLDHVGQLGVSAIFMTCPVLCCRNVILRTRLGDQAGTGPSDDVALRPLQGPVDQSSDNFDNMGSMGRVPPDICAITWRKLVITDED